MAFVNLDLESLAELDNGRVTAAFKHEMKRAVMDCMDRPGDANARTVVMEMKLTPVVADAGECDGARVEFTIKSKVPDRKSKVYSCDVRKGGVLAFSSESPTDTDQTTFNDLDGDGKINRNR